MGTNPGQQKTVFTGPPQGTATAAEVDTGASIPGYKLEINGVRFHVGDQGTGDKVVVLLHGMPDTSGAWAHQVKALVDAGFRVIAPDMLGYGETDKPEDVTRYRGEHLIADTLALLDALELAQVDVVGHDWGAFVSWELALNFPDRIRRHVTLSVGHVDRLMGVQSVEEAVENWFMYLNGQEGAPALYAANDGAFYKQWLIPTHPDIEAVWSRLKDPRAMRGSLNWDRANPMCAGYLAVETAVGERRGSVPTLGIWSSGDEYLCEAQIKETGKLMDAPWRYERIEGASHWVMLDKPQEVNRLILEWLQ